MIDLQWLLDCHEPWTRYRTRLDLLDAGQQDPAVQSDRAEMLAHPQMQALMRTAAEWPGYALKRHNDAKHPMVACGTLLDFGFRADDPGIKPVVDAILSHASEDGPFESLVFVSKAFGGLNREQWSWMACDAPTMLTILLGLGLGAEPAVQRAVDHLLDSQEENGWRCKAAASLGTFRGPGRKDDPCPIANVLALKALSLLPDMVECHAARVGASMLLDHWENQRERKIYMFGIGTDFRKLKYPFIWYDILHVVEVLSRFPHVYADERFQAMVSCILEQADEAWRFTAGSMYMAWKGWSFADKKAPSPWLTFLVARICRRLGIHFG